IYAIVPQSVQAEVNIKFGKKRKSEINNRNYNTYYLYN
ncbi:unnamed protein product, partial [Heterotrigona itama]